MTQMIQPIVVTYDMYNKISDDIMYLGDCMMIKFNTGLSRKDKNGERQSFHKEFEYGPNYDRRNSIRRSFDFYISIENYRPSPQGFRDAVRITMGDMYYVRSALNNIFKWYFDPEYSNMYASKGYELVIMNRPDRIELPLSFNKFIRFEASICIDSSQMKHPGLRIYLNHENNFVDISVDKFLAMKYFFDTVNMYESAQLMINYMERPEFGTNLISMPTDEDTSMQKEQDVQYKEGRQIPGKKKSTSFFDKIDDL